MPFMTRIPSDLHRFGLNVELVPGWETRGSSSFAPACVVDHWTAGPRGTKARPSLDVVIKGRPGIPGPLCNIYLDRAGVCVVVAAGRANHAGTGGFRGLVGNSAAYGIEAESGGDGDWTKAQMDAYPRLNAALLSGLGRDASWVCGHHIWAPTRKIDIRDIFPAVRARTAEILANPEDDDMPTAQEIAAAVWAHPLNHANGETRLTNIDNKTGDILSALKALEAVGSRDPLVNPVAEAVVNRDVVGDQDMWQWAQAQAAATATMTGQLAGLQAALQQIASAPASGVDLDAVFKAAQDGARSIVDNLRVVADPE